VGSGPTTNFGKTAKWRNPYPYLNNLQKKIAAILMGCAVQWHFQQYVAILPEYAKQKVGFGK
jgi:hypothetical protein